MFPVCMSSTPCLTLSSFVLSTQAQDSYMFALESCDPTNMWRYNLTNHSSASSFHPHDVYKTNTIKSDNQKYYNWTSVFKYVKHSDSNK